MRVANLRDHAVIGRAGEVGRPAPLVQEEDRSGGAGKTRGERARPRHTGLRRLRGARGPEREKRQRRGDDPRREIDVRADAGHAPRAQRQGDRLRTRDARSSSVATSTIGASTMTFQPHRERIRCQRRPARISAARAPPPAGSSARPRAPRSRARRRRRAPRGTGRRRPSCRRSSEQPIHLEVENAHAPEGFAEPYGASGSRSRNRRAIPSARASDGSARRRRPRGTPAAAPAPRIAARVPSRIAAQASAARARALKGRGEAARRRRGRGSSSRKPRRPRPRPAPRPRRRRERAPGAGSPGRVGIDQERRPDPPHEVHGGHARGEQATPRPCGRTHRVAPAARSFRRKTRAGVELTSGRTGRD